MRILSLRLWCWMKIVYFVCALLPSPLPLPLLLLLLMMFEKSTRLHWNYRETQPFFFTCFVSFRFVLPRENTEEKFPIHKQQGRISSSTNYICTIKAFINLSQIGCNEHLSSQASRQSRQRKSDRQKRVLNYRLFRIKTKLNVRRRSLKIHLFF